MMLSFHFIKVYKGEVDKTASPQLIFIQEGVFIMKGIINYELNEGFKGFLLVQKVNKGTTRNGSPFLNVTLSDNTGSVTAMVWDADEEKELIFTNGNIVKVKGIISEYQGIKQINLQQYRLKTDEDDVAISSLLKSAPIEGKVLVEKIKEEIDSISNVNVKDITSKIFEEYEKDFEIYPASTSVHHDYVHGLAFHTYTMMNIGKSLCEIYPELNKDLLLAGIILHDVGKVIEYSDYISPEHTLEGKLVGHISIMSEKVGQVARKLNIHDSEERLLLQHMVLAHHGKGEWGSPVAPQVLEAQILHQIDMIDAGIDAFKKGSESVNEGEFTERVFGLDNRSFYIPKI